MARTRQQEPRYWHLEEYHAPQDHGLTRSPIAAIDCNDIPCEIKRRKIEPNGRCEVFWHERIPEVEERVDWDIRSVRREALLEPARFANVLTGIIVASLDLTWLELIDKLINRILMVNGSWLVAQGSFGAGPMGPGPSRQIFYWLWAMNLEAWAISL